jgi:hypothetical protein
MRSTVVLALAAATLILTSCSSPAAPATADRTASPAAVIGHVDAPSAAPLASPAQSPSQSPSKSAAAAAPSHFGTLKPGSKLPSDAQCATWVRAKPMKESKGVNRAANARTGQHVGGSLFSGDTAKARSYIAPRIDGNFTGTTAEILRWTACKWGIDESIVFAQAAIESWWRQDTLGDWDSDASACPPGHGLGADGKAGQCPQSYGILQDRWPYMKPGWPGFGRSTAMDADLAYGTWRACFEGYETWLNTVDRGQNYAAGDAWGCVGRWFSGRWHTAAGDGYVSRVRQYEDQKIWTTRDFQQP